MNEQEHKDPPEGEADDYPTIRYEAHEDDRDYAVYGWAGEGEEFLMARVRHKLDAKLYVAAPDLKDRMDLGWDILSDLAEKGRLSEQEHEEVVRFLDSLAEVYDEYDLDRSTEVDA